MQRKQKKSEEYTQKTQNQAKDAAESAIKLDSESSFTTINDSLHFRTLGK